MTLTEFLTARLDEDEALAQAAREDYRMDLRMARDMAQHSARHNPARVLREVEAKRAILARHTKEVWDGSCFDCAEPYPCPTVRAIAAVYADHADYDEAWRP